MTAGTIVHSTFELERTYSQAPQQVFGAFAQPARKRRWYAEGEHEIQQFEMDFRPGGTERFSYRFKEGHPIAGSEIANESSYAEIEPEKRIVMTSKMLLNGKPVVVMVTTFEFETAGAGTKLVLTHQGAYLDFPGGAEMLRAGWNALVDRLGKEIAG